MTFTVPEKFRIQRLSDSSFGNCGAFLVKKDDIYFSVIASDGLGWEHVSLFPMEQNRCPTWEEMCFIKDMFWDEDDCVVQFHPAKSEYVNNHPYVLHLWRSTDREFPVPDSILVGIKEEG